MFLLCKVSLGSIMASMPSFQNIGTTRDLQMQPLLRSETW
jgi:hypothetical protein